MKDRKGLCARVVGVALTACALGLLPAAVGHARGIGSAASPAFELYLGPGFMLPGPDGIGLAASPAFELYLGPGFTLPVPEDIGSAVSPAFALDTWSGLDVEPGSSSLPLRMALHPAQPNPFTYRTSIHFDLLVGGRVRLEITDVAGRRVRTLVDGALAPGVHVSEWDGRGDGGGLRAGIYFARLEAPGGILRRKLVRLD
jgi:hypothetical protein